MDDYDDDMWGGITQVEQEKIEGILTKAETGVEVPDKDWYINTIRMLLSKVSIIGYAPYDSTFGDDKKCRCGHPYHRHFDSYDHMRPVGCKYCRCDHYEEPIDMTPEEFFQRYIKEAAAFVTNTKINGRAPDEKIMQELEGPLDIYEPMIADFRRDLVMRVGAGIVLNTPFDCNKHEVVGPAIQQIVGGG